MENTSVVYNSEDEDDSLLQEQVAEIERALSVLNKLRENTQAFHLYEQRQKALHDKASALHNAREEGKYQVQQEVAIKLLHAGVDHLIITAATGLTADQIKKLQKQITH